MTRRLLLVDDSRVAREVMKLYLANEDFELLEAKDGEAALAMVREALPALVLADLQMPLRDGISLCRALAQEEATAGVPVVILTARPDDETREACLAAGARAVLSKPVDPSVLTAAVARYAASGT